MERLRYPRWDHQGLVQKTGLVETPLYEAGENSLGIICKRLDEILDGIQGSNGC